MTRRTVTVGFALATIAAAMVAGSTQSLAATHSPDSTRFNPRSLAVAAADQAAASGLDALAKGPFEQYRETTK